jgi:hypothetical protein
MPDRPTAGPRNARPGHDMPLRRSAAIGHSRTFPDTGSGEPGRRDEIFARHNRRITPVVANAHAFHAPSSCHCRRARARRYITRACCAFDARVYAAFAPAARLRIEIRVKKDSGGEILS